MSASAVPRLAVVGAGYFAQFQLQAWQRCGLTPAAICDSDRARAAAAAERFGIPAVYTDLASLLREQQPELIDTVLPPAAQAAVLPACLAAASITITQKPFGRDLAEARELTAQAQRLGRTLVVHENFRFSPWFREARRLIDSGMIGRVHGLSFRLRPGDGQGLKAYLDRQPYFQTMSRLLVVETAVHYIDTFRYLLGEVRAVTARLRRLNPAIAGEDAALIVFEFDADVQAVFDGNRLNEHPAREQRRTMGEMWLEGSAGVLRLDGDARLWWQPHGEAEREHAYAQDEQAVFGGACEALQAHVLAHWRHGAVLENRAEDYLRNLEVQEAIYSSHASGQRLVMSGFSVPDQPVPLRLG